MEEINHKSSGNSEDRPGLTVSARLAAWIIATILLLVLFLLGFLSPIDKLHKMNERYLSIPADDPSWRWTSWTVPRVPEESALLSRLLASETDSLTLYFNLPDSTLDLILKGVVVHRAPVHHWKASRFFSQLDPGAGLNFFSLPHAVAYQYATITKVPSVIRYAPKDTLEASLIPPVAPDTSLPVFLYFSMLTADGVRIDIRQHEKGRSYLKRGVTTFRMGWRKTMALMMDVAHFRVPGYSPWILIEVDALNVRTIYRALPIEPYVILPVELTGINADARLTGAGPS